MPKVTPQKLDVFNKILLATGSINYMASAVYSLNEQMKTIPDPKGIFKEFNDKRDEDLVKALGHLKSAMEILGNSIEEPCALDLYVTTPAFNVVMHGYDDVECDFENLEKQ